MKNNMKKKKEAKNCGSRTEKNCASKTKDCH